MGAAHTTATVAVTNRRRLRNHPKAKAVERQRQRRKRSPQSRVTAGMECIRKLGERDGPASWPEFATQVGRRFHGDRKADDGDAPNGVWGRSGRRHCGSDCHRVDSKWKWTGNTTRKCRPPRPRRSPKAAIGNGDRNPRGSGTHPTLRAANFACGARQRLPFCRGGRHAMQCSAWPARPQLIMSLSAGLLDCAKSGGDPSQPSSSQRTRGHLSR